MVQDGLIPIGKLLRGVRQAIRGVDDGAGADPATFTHPGSSLLAWRLLLVQKSPASYEM